MILPERSRFLELAGPGKVVPLYRELPADLETPLSLYLKLRAEGPSFLFESVEKGQNRGRFSFLGRAPGSYFESKPGAAEDPFTLLQQKMSGLQAVNLPELPSFWGGAVGFFGYDVVRRLEPLGEGPADDLELPDALFIQSRESVLFDHAQQKMFVVVAVETTEDSEADFERGRQDLERFIDQLRQPLAYRPPSPPSHPPNGGDRFNRTREDYMAAVVQAQEHIKAGDIFQIVLSQRCQRTTWTDHISIYRALRITNPSPYMFLLDFNQFQLIGSSPEMLVKLENGTAETHPIAGTRRRGEDAEQDEHLSKDLLEDPKERAEHIMLVDLGRNDLGRVCRYGSVTVPQFMEVELFSHVIHLVSKVQGELRPELSGFDLTRACFPAGTVSGAPKVRAMQLLDELEPTRRGPYAGAVGYFSYWGATDTCIAIRTLVKKGDELYLQAGAGIVADSVPESEYDETLAKLAALRRAVDLAETELCS